MQYGHPILWGKYAISFQIYSGATHSFWMTALIAVLFLRSSCEILCREIWYTWSLTNPRGSIRSGLSQMTFLADLVKYIFQFLNSETFCARENAQNVWCDEKLHFAGNQHSGVMFELLTGWECPFSWNDRLLWLFHYPINMDPWNNWYAQHASLVLFDVPFGLLNLP